MTKILIVEDDKDLAEELAGWLKEKDYQVVIAENELATEQKLSEEGGNISVALVDMQAPSKEKGLNYKETGLRLIKLINSSYPDIVSIVHTGHSDLQNAAKCMEAGAFSYLSKGDNADLLLQVLKRAEERGKALKELKESQKVVKKSQGVAKRILKDIDKFQNTIKDANHLINRFTETIERIQEEMNEIKK
jgi:two-component system, NtrC family, response regulator